MGEYILAPAAQRDLEEIWEFIAADSLDAADRWVDKLEKAMDLLADIPTFGHTRKDLTDKPVLFWSVGRYLIIFRPEKQLLEIVRVLSAYRDVSRLL